MHEDLEVSSTASEPEALSGNVRRRAVVRGGALLPVGAVILAGCGSAEEPEATEEPSAEVESGDDSDVAGDGESGDAEASGFPSADVPVGGATYDEESNVVFSQPSEGEFRAFDATCPHQGCAVSDFSEGTLICPCHASMFDPDSGEVLGGPATTGLTAKDVTVSGDDLIVS